MTENAVRPLRTQRLPLTVQAQQYLLGLVQNGTYRPGDRLPPQDDLATQLGISRPTLREALLNLEQEGIIISRHGVGTFVAPWYGERLSAGLEHLESILEMAHHQGMEPHFESLEVEVAPADEEMADALQVELGTPLTHVRRTIEVDGAPIAYMVDVAPTSVLAPADLGEEFDGSVLDLLRHKPEVRLAHAVANIVALNADAGLAHRLNTGPQQALLLLEETLYDEGGNVVEYSRNYFHPEFFRFHVVRR
jgi:GntR family transcriptional regulator